MVRASASAAARSNGTGGVSITACIRAGARGVRRRRGVTGTGTAASSIAAACPSSSRRTAIPSFGTWYPRDAGDYGMTSYSASRAQAIVGADAPDNAIFMPAAIAGTRGQAITIERAVAIYERDAGVLWRHAAEGERARQLVLSGYRLSITTTISSTGFSVRTVPSTCRSSSPGS